MSQPGIRLSALPAQSLALKRLCRSQVTNRQFLGELGVREQELHEADSPRPPLRRLGLSPTTAGRSQPAGLGHRVAEPTPAAQARPGGTAEFLPLRGAALASAMPMSSGVLPDHACLEAPSDFCQLLSLCWSRCLTYVRVLVKAAQVPALAVWDVEHTTGCSLPLCAQPQVRTGLGSPARPGGLCEMTPGRHLEQHPAQGKDTQREDRWFPKRASELSSEAKFFPFHPPLHVVQELLSGLNSQFLEVH